MGIANNYTIMLQHLQKGEKLLVHHYTDISLDTLHRVVSQVDVADHAPFVWDQDVRDNAAQLNHPHCDIIFITERVPTRDQNNVHGFLFSNLRKNVNFYFSNIRVQLIENKRFSNQRITPH